MQSNKKQNNEELTDIDIKICVVCIFAIVLWLLLLLVPKVLGVILFIAFIILVPILFIGGMETINEQNNGKKGYYAEYGTSYGSNAEKHKKYLEEKIANEIMK